MDVYTSTAGERLISVGYSSGHVISATESMPCSQETSIDIFLASVNVMLFLIIIAMALWRRRRTAPALPEEQGYVELSEL